VFAQARSPTDPAYLEHLIRMEINKWIDIFNDENDSRILAFKASTSCCVKKGKRKKKKRSKNPPWTKSASSDSLRVPSKLALENDKQARK
jgi:hypothetical protein